MAQQTGRHLVLRPKQTIRAEGEAKESSDLVPTRGRLGVFSFRGFDICDYYHLAFVIVSESVGFSNCRHTCSDHQSIFTPLRDYSIPALAAQSGKYSILEDPPLDMGHTSSYSLTQGYAAYARDPRNIFPASPLSKTGTCLSSIGGLFDVPLCVQRSRVDLTKCVFRKASTTCVASQRDVRSKFCRRRGFGRRLRFYSARDDLGRIVQTLLGGDHRSVPFVPFP
ncbi:hypothetical protein K491DRAFT_157555 [Lophiostoma macrostomum CBS 122681]|uniref:Uncharacterized protein n=1 Tax=Lophiostoma macrostomum CBS 122681 TaxID=1314788 RepID=A0A6A6SUT6_9PLEO|nr:hypothetical protein K491DRAFT_157555 [Lophiostoma macrostomum CBS 122681]